MNVSIEYKPRKTIKKGKIKQMNKAGLVYSVDCKDCDKISTSKKDKRVTCMEATNYSSILSLEKLATDS